MMPHRSFLEQELMVKKGEAETRGVEKNLAGPRSLTRLLGLFGVLSQAAHGMSLAELSVTLKTPKSSLLNLLRPLVAEDYLLHGNGNYQLGPSIYRLCSGVLASWNFPKLIRPLMEEASRRTGETVILSALNREAGTVTYVEIIDSPHPVRYQIPVGTTRPLYATSGGRLLLAYADKNWLDEYLASVTFNTKTAVPITRQILMRELKQIRADGLSCSMDFYLKGLSGVTAPVLNTDGHCIAALTIAGPTERFRHNFKSLKATVKQVAEKVSGITADKQMSK